MVFNPIFVAFSPFFPAVIKMEGGTENDLRILEQEEEEERTEKAEGAKKEEPRPPEPPGKGPSERPDGDDSNKVGGFWGSLRGFWCPLESILGPPGDFFLGALGYFFECLGGFFLGPPVGYFFFFLVPCGIFFGCPGGFFFPGL